MKKRILALVMAMMMACLLLACGGEKNSSSDNNTKAEETDKDYVVSNGKLVVGITDFEPCDYKDENGKWIGFDAELAEAFAAYLGIDCEFVEIDWDNKILELDGKSIDCVWNGMTLTEEVTSSMNCTNAYLNNAQVIIVPKDVADKYSSVADLEGLTFAVENGSAGQEQAEENVLDYIGVQNQAAALMEVAAGTADGAIIDSLMAAAMVGEGTSYDNLTYILPLNDEKYGVGFRKGSNLKDEANEFFKKAYADGTIDKIAEKYGVSAAVVAQ